MVFLGADSDLPSEVWTVETAHFVFHCETVIRACDITPGGAAIDYQGLWKSARCVSWRRAAAHWLFFCHDSRVGVPLLYTERVETSKAHIADKMESFVHAGAQRRTAP